MKIMNGGSPFEMVPIFRIFFNLADSLSTGKRTHLHTTTLPQCVDLHFCLLVGSIIFPSLMEGSLVYTDRTRLVRVTNDRKYFPG